MEKLKISKEIGRPALIETLEDLCCFSEDYQDELVAQLKNFKELAQDVGVDPAELKRMDNAIAYAEGIGR